MKLPGPEKSSWANFRSGKKYLATIEPWHGNQVVVYLPPEQKGDLWDRKVLDATLKQAHALWCADLDGDGDDEIVVGWREPSDSTGRPGIVLYDSVDENWKRREKVSD